LGKIKKIIFLVAKVFRIGQNVIGLTCRSGEKVNPPRQPGGIQVWREIEK
jgi:hypothetical protein